LLRVIKRERKWVLGSKGVQNQKRRGELLIFSLYILPFPFGLKMALSLEVLGVFPFKKGAPNSIYTNLFFLGLKGF